jgi:hypothetical protein
MQLARKTNGENMDIRKFEVQDVATIHLNGPDDKPWFIDGAPVTVTIYGPGSAQFVKATAANNQRLIKQMTAGTEVEQQTPEEKARFLADITQSFSEDVEIDDLKGDALHVAIYSNLKLGFIGEQVQKKSAKWSVFMKGSTAN